MTPQRQSRARIIITVIIALVVVTILRALVEQGAHHVAPPAPPDTDLRPTSTRTEQAPPRGGQRENTERDVPREERVIGATLAAPDAAAVGAAPVLIDAGNAVERPINTRDDREPDLGSILPAIADCLQSWRQFEPLTDREWLLEVQFIGGANNVGQVARVTVADGGAALFALNACVRSALGSLSIALEEDAGSILQLSLKTRDMHSDAGAP